MSQLRAILDSIVYWFGIGKELCETSIDATRLSTRTAIIACLPFVIVQGGLFTLAQEKSAETTAASADPFLWLEDVLGEKALAWVNDQNAITKQALESDPEFEPLRKDLLAILDSDARIPAVVKRGEYYYNFWRDKNNERGLWRRTTLDEYRKAESKWDVILDLDALAKAENENWVWKSVELLRPDYELALISLSRGGADATVTREFNLKTRTFVEGGFSRPESKGSMGWIDKDTVFVQTDFGDNAMTSSGYPRIAKRWKRGTPMSSAKTIYQGVNEDLAISAVHDDSPGYERDFVSRAIAFYSDELYLIKSNDELQKIDVPNSANKSTFHQWLVIELREPWEVNQASYKAGSLLMADFKSYLEGDRNLDVVFEPTDTTALASYAFTKDYLVLNVLEDVKNRLYVIDINTPGRERERLVGAPEFGTVDFTAVDPEESNDYFLTSADYLTPTSLSMGTIGQKPTLLKQLPAFYDAAGLKIEQNFATSADGTRIPYFMVSRSDAKLNGDNPTLLYGYGGFEISLQPTYNASVGRAWTSQGGVYVVANIRGGGEYGPRWHQAALKANRLRAYEDFAAVAQDLVKRGVTRPEKLGIQGGSNGGLLVGNMFTLYPDLCQAVVCQVPLLDMKRYNKLLAGASWMAEYGDPDDPAQWEFIQAYSPYQNLKSDTKYPQVLFTTSTRDDRVHPGHARKMMAKMDSYGLPALYYENIEGGHGGAANNKQSAYMQALAYTFFRQQLMNSTRRE